MKKMYKKILLVLTISLVVLCGLFLLKPTFIHGNADENNYELAKCDKDILRYYRTPDIEDDFSENSISVILKSKYSYLTSIEFEDFYPLDSEIYSIGNYTDIIYKNENGSLPLTKKQNHMLLLELVNAGKRAVLNAIEELNRLDMVLLAEPVYIYKKSYEWMPGDYYNSKQWNLKDSSAGIYAESAWNITRGSSTVNVGILEDNIDLTHVDLAGRISRHDWGSWEDPDMDHATHIAGIIGAIHNSGGVAGISQSSMTVLVDGYLLFDMFTTILTYAENNGIKVINASYINTDSLGNPADSNATHFAAIQQYSGLFVAAAGNETRNIDTNPVYPAAYDLDNLIAVGSVDNYNTRSDFSNYGNKVKIYAPGSTLETTTNIYSTLSGNTYGYKAGTSMAAPHVTGVAALMLSINPNLTGAQLKTKILANSDEIDITYDGSSHTVKKLNAFKAVSSVAFQISACGDDEIEITGLNFTPGAELAIPDTIDGKTVKSIGDNAFDSCLDLTNVTLPSTITNIGEYAFVCCADLEEINIPASVTTIGKLAFYDCESLTEITIPSGVTVLNRMTFGDCYSLSKIIIKNTSQAVTFGDYAFNNIASNANIYVYYELYDTYYNSVASGYRNMLTRVCFEGDNTYLVNYYEVNGASYVTLQSYLSYSTGDYAYTNYAIIHKPSEYYSYFTECTVNIDNILTLYDINENDMLKSTFFFTSSTLYYTMSYVYDGITVAYSNNGIGNFNIDITSIIGQDDTTFELRPGIISTNSVSFYNYNVVLKFMVKGSAVV